MVIYGLSSNFIVDPLVRRKQGLCLDLISDNCVVVDFKGDYEELFKMFRWGFVGLNKWVKI
ncbi:hypothetical protein ACVRXF_10445 [Streptococcus orisasini]